MTGEGGTPRNVARRRAAGWLAHPRAVDAVAVCILLLLGWLDYATGYEFGFFIFYFIPVSLTAWFGERRSGIVMACASAVAWYLSDLLAHHPYSHPYFLYWETFMRLASFLTTAVTLDRIRTAVANERRLNEALRRALAENEQMRCRLREHEAAEPAENPAPRGP